MIGVVVPQKTARLDYTLEFIFAARGISYTILSPDEAETFSHPMIAYGVKLDSAVFEFTASEVLFHQDVRQYAVEKAEMGEQELLAFNGVSDLFASIFYVLSRYEEYLSSDYDQHGRFPARASLQHRFGWLDKVVCDRWAAFILDTLGLSGTAQFALVPSFDIDNTYAYRYKKGWRARLSFLKDFKNLDFARMRERRAVRRGAHDPYDTFEKIRTVQARFPQTRIFWLVAPLGEKDRNLSSELAPHQELIRSMDANNTVGLHPGYVSNSRSEKIEFEKRSLEQILGRSVETSRQHFLRFRLPETYAALIQCGFRHEYSMGFAEFPGFRAGTARAFAWFDLLQNQQTDLIVHPFVYMDGTLNEYMKLSVQESKETVARLCAEVRCYGGEFVFIWHNETIGDYRSWKGWSEVLDYTLNLKV